VANPLTGDFEAVLQVAGRTVNRLMASMHQDAGTDPDVPHFPHAATLRIGDGHPVDGVKGTLWAQLGVPRVELIHGSTDRLALSVGIRTRFWADQDSEAFPEIVHGTVKAQYRMDQVDPNCPGWHSKAADYVWVRVIADTVEFNGDAFNDADWFDGISLYPEDTHDRVVRQLVALLTTEFEATPVYVSGRFRRGAMRSLDQGSGRSAVTVPIGLTVDPPGGDLASVNDVFLDGWDFGVAVSREYLLSRIQPTLDDLRATFYQEFSIRIRVHTDLGFLGGIDWVDKTITWRATLTQATADWVADGNFLGLPPGAIVIRIAGQAPASDAEYNLTFDVTQVLAVRLDGASQTLVVDRLGGPVVNVNAGGDYANEIRANAKPNIEAAVNQQVNALLSQPGSAIALADYTAELIKELKTLDGGASAWFENAEFRQDGVVVLGTIALSPRSRPVSKFVRTDDADGYNAFESWIPGGRVDSFEWSWSWFNSPKLPSGTTEPDRFILHRPRQAGGLGKFGAAIDVEQPLPGLDGMGRICLAITGKQVNAASGAFEEVESAVHCIRFGHGIRTGYGDVTGRLLLRHFPDIHRAGPPPPPETRLGEQALVAVSPAHATAPASNTLVLFAGSGWEPDTAAALRKGLDACTRDDAGMLVLVLFDEGVLDAAGTGLWEEMEKLDRGLEAPLVVNEDVHGSWSSALDAAGRDGAQAWRLLSPTGGLTWSHDGPVEAEGLAGVLDDGLVRSDPPAAEDIRPHLDLGLRVPHDFLDPGWWGGQAQRNCPPLPLGRPGIGSMVVVFLRDDSVASSAKLRQVTTEQDREGGPLVAVVVDGAEPEKARTLVEGMGPNFIAVGDPLGAVAARFLIRHWPTTVTIDERATVVGVEIGAPVAEPGAEATA
jgi:hypothetical protein